MNNEKMKITDKQRYVTPALLQQVELLLERDLLAGSVVDNVAPVKTSGQEINGIYDGTDTDVSSATFNYDWGE